MAGILPSMSSLREAAISLFETLDRMGIVYAVGGSFASSLHGIARATQDIDIVVDLRADQVAGLFNALAPAFYLGQDAMMLAFTRGSAFNVIHFESGLKIDLFVASRHPLGAEQLSHRRVEATALLGGEPVEVSIISANDIVLVKLLWYREGGDISERQWNDLANLVAVQGSQLDREYLNIQAKRLGVADLLIRLLS
jgi:hypothetical protein